MLYLHIKNIINQLDNLSTKNSFDNIVSLKKTYFVLDAPNRSLKDTTWGVLIFIQLEILHALPAYKKYNKSIGQPVNEK